MAIRGLYREDEIMYQQMVYENMVHQQRAMGQIYGGDLCQNQANAVNDKAAIEQVTRERTLLLLEDV